MSDKEIIWITGASSGIGEAVALRLAQGSPHRVIVISARSTEKLKALEEQIVQCGATGVVKSVDVTDREAVLKAGREIHEEFGAVHTLITSAGNFIPSEPGEEFPSEEYVGQMRVNYEGTLYALEAVVPDMVERGRGTIGIVSSVVGYRGLPRAAAYAASKAALIAFTESMRFHLEPKGIQVSVINPGFVKTPLTDKNDFPMPFIVSSEEAAKHIVNGLERGRDEIHFPKIFSWLLKLLRIIPFPVYKFLIRNTVVRSRS